MLVHHGNGGPRAASSGARLRAAPCPAWRTRCPVCRDRPPSAPARRAWWPGPPSRSCSAEVPGGLPGEDVHHHQAVLCLPPRVSKIGRVREKDLFPPPLFSRPKPAEGSWVSKQHIGFGVLEKNQIGLGEPASNPQRVGRTSINPPSGLADQYFNQK